MVDWKSKALIICTSETEYKDHWCRWGSGVTCLCYSEHNEEKCVSLNIYDFQCNSFNGIACCWAYE